MTQWGTVSSVLKHMENAVQADFAALLGRLLRRGLFMFIKFGETHQWFGPQLYFKASRKLQDKQVH